MTGCNAHWIMLKWSGVKRSSRGLARKSRRGFGTWSMRGGKEKIQNLVIQ